MLKALLATHPAAIETAHPAGAARGDRPRYYDELIPIGDMGMRWARELAAKKGIFTGVSGGSAFGSAMHAEL